MSVMVGSEEYGTARRRGQRTADASPSGRRGRREVGYGRRVSASRWVRLLTAAALVLAGRSGAWAAGELDAMGEVVHDACECAAVHPTGLDAALLCTDGPRDFGRLKVRLRGGFDAALAKQAADLERVIETCLANAIDEATARERLGLPPADRAGSPALVRWRRVPPSTLERHPTRLVRIRRTSGVTLKGMVDEVSAATVLLRTARMDGGVEHRIPLADIRGAWIMVLP